MVKKFLTVKNQEFTVVDIDQHPEKQEELTKLSGTLSVPVTVSDKGMVVGWNPSKLLEII